MYYVYIIYSKSIDQYYVGQTSNLEARLLQHQSSMSKFTKKVQDWELKFSNSFQTRTEAIMNEFEIKKKKKKKIY